MNRRLLVAWMYGVAAVHLLVGLALPWIGGWSVLDPYHRSVEAWFWSAGAPAAARAQQEWWMALFGPTVQSLSLWMAALIYFGDRYRSAFAWAILLAGLLLWAPQDMLFSLRAKVWAHVWVDLFAVLTMAPPLAWLWWLDSRPRDRASS
jgi:hypothetical protein